MSASAQLESNLDFKVTIKTDVSRFFYGYIFGLLIFSEFNIEFLVLFLYAGCLACFSVIIASCFLVLGSVHENNTFTFDSFDELNCLCCYAYATHRR